jgi:hypothetical protein
MSYQVHPHQHFITSYFCNTTLSAIPRSHVVPGTPLTPTSQVSSPIPKRKFKIKTALRPNSSSSSCKRALRNRRDKKKALRRAYRKCKYIEHQAHDSGDSESNSSDLDDASNDSCMTSNSDASDGSWAGYALGMSSQAEASKLFH